jgi:RNA polymerase sigma-70 factor (ECF subfamily)
MIEHSLNAATLERYLDAAILERNLEAATSERSLDAAILERNLDAATSERSLDAATIKNRLGAPVAEDDFDALVNAAVNGERDAVDRVLRWVRPLVLRYCRARVGGQEKTFASADDVAQEVCLAVLTALPSYRDQGRPFLSFVYGIASHKVADAHRNAARNRSEPVPEVPDIPDQAAGPEAQAMQEEFPEPLAWLIDTLPDEQREILRLRVVVGLTTEQTAEVVSSTPGAVRVVHHRALSRLRNVLASRRLSAGENDETGAENAGELGHLLEAADRALRETVNAATGDPFKTDGLESIKGDYIHHLLQVADAHLRQKLNMGDVSRREDGAGDLGGAAESKR